MPIHFKGRRWASPNVITDLLDRQLEVVAVIRPDPIYHAPTSTDAAVTTPEDTAIVLAFDAFGDYQDADGDAMAAVRIVTLPTAGTLQYRDGNAWAEVIADQEISAEQLASSALRFIPDPDDNGSPYATLTFQVGDGRLFSATHTLTINVTPVNDAPSSTDVAVTTLEDTPLVLGVDAFGAFQDVDGDTLAAVRITALPAVGALQWLDGAAWTAVSVDQDLTVAQLTAGAVRFVPEANASGSPYAVIEFLVSDGTVFSDTANTLTISVSPVNDYPTSTDVTLTTLEDTPLVLGTASFGDYHDIEGDPLAEVRIASLPTAGTLQWFNGSAWVGASAGQVFSVAQLVAEALRFMPGPDENGDAYATLTFQVGDGQAFSAVANTLTINVTPVEDAVITYQTVYCQIVSGAVRRVGTAVSFLYEQCEASLEFGFYPITGYPRLLFAVERLADGVPDRLVTEQDGLSPSFGASVGSSGLSSTPSVIGGIPVTTLSKSGTCTSCNATSNFSSLSSSGADLTLSVAATITVGGTPQVLSAATAIFKAITAADAPLAFTYASALGRVIVFKADATFTLADYGLSPGTSVEYLLVGGGGGGGRNGGGGGGAGGVLTGTLTATETAYPITVGAGGLASTADQANGQSGGNTTAFGLTAVGGGGGGSSNSDAKYGLSGGSGGGGSASGTGGAGTSGQGYAGGNGWATTNYAGGGGGGAGAAGGNAPSSTRGGAGGNGVSSSLTGAALCYGGGGGGRSTSTAGAAGMGGGGRGSGLTLVALPGMDGRGGGGGGGSQVSGSKPPARGGSGIVILRVPLA